jgi:hypothetical protein
MHRIWYRRGMAAVFALLTLAIAFEAVHFAKDGVQSLLDIGNPRSVIDALIKLGLAVLFGSLAWRTLGLARVSLTISRLVRDRDRSV